MSDHPREAKIVHEPLKFSKGLVATSKGMVCGCSRTRRFWPEYADLGLRASTQKLEIAGYLPATNAPDLTAITSKRHPPAPPPSTFGMSLFRCVVDAPYLLPILSGLKISACRPESRVTMKRDTGE